MKYLLSLLFFAVFFLFSVSEIKAQVVINEFHPRSPEWVEFYNKGVSTENLSEYFFDDDTDFYSDSGSSSKFNLSGLLPGGSLCFWEMITYLNDSGDNPTLFASNGDIIDSYSYASSSAEKTYARIPDGGEWSISDPNKTTISCLSLPTPTPTPAPTNTPTPTPSPSHSPTPTSIAALTKTPTPTPTKSLTPLPSSGFTPTAHPEGQATPESSAEELVLGIQNSDSSPSATPKEEVVSEKKFPVFPVILIITGFLFIAGAVFFFVKNNVKKVS